MSSYDWRSQLESELGHVDECWKTHKKVGMKKVGYINWSNGNMKGTVWLKVKN